MKYTLTKISLFIGLLGLFFSCNVVKRVPDDKYLLTNNTILVDSVKAKNAGVYSQLAQKPNPAIPLIRFPFGLIVYNMADPEPDSTFNRWLQRTPNREKRLVNLLSKKQVNGMESIYVDFNKWLRTSGDAHDKISEAKIDKSTDSIKEGYHEYGD